MVKAATASMETEDGIPTRDTIERDITVEDANKLLTKTPAICNNAFELFGLERTFSEIAIVLTIPIYKITLNTMNITTNSSCKIDKAREAELPTRRHIVLIVGWSVYAHVTTAEATTKTILTGRIAIPGQKSKPRILNGCTTKHRNLSSAIKDEERSEAKMADMIMTPDIWHHSEVPQ